MKKTMKNKMTPSILIMMGILLISMGAYQTAVAASIPCSICLLNATDNCNGEHVAPGGQPSCLGASTSTVCVSSSRPCGRCDGGFSSATSICIAWPSPTSSCKTAPWTADCGTMYERTCEWDALESTCVCPSAGGTPAGTCEYQMCESS